MSASGESSTTMHRILHASGSHPIPTPYDPKPRTAATSAALPCAIARRTAPTSAQQFAHGAAGQCLGHHAERRSSNGHRAPPFSNARAREINSPSAIDRATVAREGAHRTALMHDKRASRYPAGRGADPARGAPGGGSRTSILPPPMLNKLSSIFVRESRSQYLCDPQWFRDTASRGPTTCVTPKPHFRTSPSDHGKAPNNIAP
ncbi:hypothetical protein F511_39398 [Dorcoceras hygrometricum]|uniref:Uncharacterized protein n=1 Tax=Dorcoceras hygrometricum TaxID=472368 RepID=A0A2Z7DGG5_9LAMI|nr:hypothetical protein F511_39398 [Dorcoceras hygrometricum]